MSRKARAKRVKRVGRPNQNGEGDFWPPAYGRPAMGRMDEMRALISAGKFPNSKTMARDLGWSVRTVKRDLAFIRERLNWPLKFNQERNGFYFTKPVPFFPSIPLTEKEVVGLFVAQKSIEQYKGTALEPVLAGAFRKMMASLDDSAKYSLGDLDEVLSVRPFAPGDTELATFELLTKAIRERRAVRFTYRKRGELKTAPKFVRPYHIGYVRNQWTLFAFDPKPNAMRKFVLVRLSKPVLTDERFTMTEKFDINKELGGSMGLFKGDEDHEIVVEFDRWGADDVRGRRWHSSQKLTKLAQGRLRVEMRLNSLEEVEGWVLGFGPHATVIGPPELRERVGKIGAGLAQRYAPT